MMGKRRIESVADVAKWRLCLGCGACAYACSEGKIELRDYQDQGIRPLILGEDCSSCPDCVSVCPGVEMAHPGDFQRDQPLGELTEGWGPILEVWEGYASDTSLRHQGSSGGIASALSLFCIEEGDMQGVVHIGSKSEEPHRNVSVFSKTRSELSSTTGSRYSPASPCDSLALIEDARRPCVFVGKPCDIQGLRKAQLLRPNLKKNLGVAIGIFCAGTPSTKGALDLLAEHGIDPEDVEEIKYRGRGWPGWFSVRLKGHSDWKGLASYAEAWGFLQKYRPFRCYLCPDSTSEFADISCGDPWYRPIDKGDPGRSLVLVRTERGRQIVAAAMEAGYVQLTAANPKVLALSQNELLRKRGAIWGRLLTMRIFGVPSPRVRGFSLFKNWLRLSISDKLRSVFGTAKRITVRRYRRPLN